MGSHMETAAQEIQIMTATAEIMVMTRETEITTEATVIIREMEMMIPMTEITADSETSSLIRLEIKQHSALCTDKDN